MKMYVFLSNYKKISLAFGALIGGGFIIWRILKYFRTSSRPYEIVDKEDKEDIKNLEQELSNEEKKYSLKFKFKA